MTRTTELDFSLVTFSTFCEYCSAIAWRMWRWTDYDHSELHTKSNKLVSVLSATSETPSGTPAVTTSSDVTRKLFNICLFLLCIVCQAKEAAPFLYKQEANHLQEHTDKHVCTPPSSPPPPHTHTHTHTHARTHTHRHSKKDCCCYLFTHVQCKSVLFNHAVGQPICLSCCRCNQGRHPPPYHLLQPVLSQRVWTENRYTWRHLAGVQCCNRPSHLFHLSIRIVTLPYFAKNWAVSLRCSSERLHLHIGGAIAQHFSLPFKSQRIHTSKSDHGFSMHIAYTTILAQQFISSTCSSLTGDGRGRRNVIFSTLLFWFYISCFDAEPPVVVTTPARCTQTDQSGKFQHVMITGRPLWSITVAVVTPGHPNHFLVSSMYGVPGWEFPLGCQTKLSYFLLNFVKSTCQSSCSSPFICFKVPGADCV